MSESTAHQRLRPVRLQARIRVRALRPGSAALYRSRNASIAAIRFRCSRICRSMASWSIGRFHFVHSRANSRVTGSCRSSGVAEPSKATVIREIPRLHDGGAGKEHYAVLGVISRSRQELFIFPSSYDRAWPRPPRA